jgi:hypothetical protein
MKREKDVLTVRERALSSISDFCLPAVRDVEHRTVVSYLSVCNDGPAPPPGFDPAASAGIGLKIMLALVERIGWLRAAVLGANDGIVPRRA